jgi:opacity protein-like surface antigen
VRIAGGSHANLNGDIWEDADPEFNNFTYSYKVSHAEIALKGRLIGSYNCAIVDPYISASAGIGFNRAYDFTINPVISEAVPAPAFGSNTTTAFTYALGIGIQKSFTPHLQAAIGYEFSNWGKIQLAHAPGQTVGEGLSLNHFYAQEIQFSLFYIV